MPRSKGAASGGHAQHCSEKTGEAWTTPARCRRRPEQRDAAVTAAQIETILQYALTIERARETAGQQRGSTQQQCGFRHTGDLDVPGTNTKGREGQHWQRHTRRKSTAIKAGRGTAAAAGHDTTAQQLRGWGHDALPRRHTTAGGCRRRSSGGRRTPPPKLRKQTRRRRRRTPSALLPSVVCVAVLLIFTVADSRPSAFTQAQGGS
jgi:hypothetical protein